MQARSTKYLRHEPQSPLERVSLYSLVAVQSSLRSNSAIGVCLARLYAPLSTEAIADVRGFVTATSIYAYVDEIFTPWDQRPLLRASVAGLRPLRRAKQAVSDDMLRNLVIRFPTADYVYPLDPSYEPTAEQRNAENEAIFAWLQSLRAARLVEPVGTPHMYDAAMKRKSCRLTALGQAYWHQVRNGKF